MRTGEWKIGLVALCFCVSVVSRCAGKVIYVDTDAAGANDGSSWENAYNFLQDALADANAAEKPVEIRVAQGTYRPDEDALNPDGTGGAGNSFGLISNVSIRGGYAGLGQADPNARDIELYETILSGDLAQNDVEVADPCDLLTHPTRGENSYNVIIASYVNETGVLDGFSIIGGNGGYGGGMYCGSRGYPILINCTFRDNSAKEQGGGVYDMWTTVFIDCSFIHNAAGWRGGGYANWDSGEVEMIGCRFERNYAPEGGAISGEDSGVATLVDCTFIENSADSGGAIWAYALGCELFGCRFIGNSASETGGAITIESSLTLTNCSFTGNSASEAGGALATSMGRGIFSNCTFAGNTTPKGSIVVCDHLYRYLDPWRTGQMTNCIIRNGGGETWNNRDYPVTISYSDIEGGQASIFDPCSMVVWGDGNIDVDPCFADPGYWDANGTPEDANDELWVDGDYHLKSQGGRWEPAAQAWIIDGITSPCVDAGDPMSPTGLEAFPNGGIVNMGAYGGTVEASKSYFGKAPCEVIVAGDINGDCVVDFKDFTIMALHWCESSEGEAGPGVSYEVGECTGRSDTKTVSKAAEFSVEVRGAYIHFEDVIGGNCCPDKIEVQMAVEGDAISVFEDEYLSSPCRCTCSYPTTAELGPFEDGTYKLDVYKREFTGGQVVSEVLIGSASVMIGG